MALTLEAAQVVKTYRSGSTSVNAVDGVSFGVEPGEFVGLVGPSGSGKTTLLALVAGLLSPTSGDITIQNHNLTAMKERQRVAFRRRYIGFTFQANNLVPYLTVTENVELMLRLNGEYTAASRARARDILVRLGLEERLNSLPRQLSGGQQQRVAIARSLINQPRLVLADEPTASLDTERAFQVVQTMAELVHEEERAGIMVTHDLRMVRHVDRVIQMVDGHIERELTEIQDLACLADPANCERIPRDALGLGPCPCAN